MSTGTICDNCGKPAETQERGLVKKIDYCDSCVPWADLFRTGLDEIHTDLARQCEERIARLTKEFAGMVLPDV